MNLTEKDKKIVKEKLSNFCRECINCGVCEGEEDVDCVCCPIANAYKMIDETSFEEEF